MDDGEWLTLGEAALRLGTSPDALRQRIRRNKVLARRGNDGRPRVFVASERTGQSERQASACPVLPNRTESGQTEQTGQDAVIAELRRQLSEQQTRSRLDMETALNRQQAAHESALDRADRQHKAEIDRLSQAHKSAVTALMDRVGRMLVERRERRPWWARLFGAPKIAGT